VITVNPRLQTLDPSLIKDYYKVAPATLGHGLNSAMHPHIEALWKPVKLVGHAVTVQTHPHTVSAMYAALEIIEKGDILVVNRDSDERYAPFGEFACHKFIEAGAGGLVIDGPVTDQNAIHELRFPVFSKSTSAMTVKPLGLSEGAVNIPVQVGGVAVNPGDMILADDDGVLVVTPEQARDLISFGLEKEEWETWVRKELKSGRGISSIMNEHPSPKAPQYQ